MIAPTSAQVAQSRETIRRGSKSFAAASRLFAPTLRDHATLLYAWCRHCDDVVDGQTLGHGPIGRDAAAARADLERLHAQTRDALAGRATSDPIFAGLAHVVATHEIPHRHAFDLLAGMRMDVDNRAYDTLADTLEYCYHVAGVVGVMMAHLMGVRDPEQLDRAADLGIALQLTNIARDVLADADGSRLYLPAAWLREAGVPPERASDRAHRAALFGVVRRIVETAEPYYASARWGLPHLSFRSAWAIAAARDVYREIGLRVVANGPAGMARRAATTRGHRAWRLVRSAGSAARAVLVDRGRPHPARSPLLWTKRET